MKTGYKIVYRGKFAIGRPVEVYNFHVLNEVLNLYTPSPLRKKYCIGVWKLKNLKQ